MVSGREFRFQWIIFATNLLVQTMLNTDLIVSTSIHQADCLRLAKYKENYLQRCSSETAEQRQERLAKRRQLQQKQLYQNLHL